MLEHRFLTRAGALKHREVVADAVRVPAAQEPHQALEKAYAEIERLKDQVQKENIVLREEIDKTSMFEEIVGVFIASARRYCLSLQGCSDRLNRADHRGDRHGQGARRSGDPQAVAAIRSCLHRRQLRGDSLDH